MYIQYKVGRENMKVYICQVLFKFVILFVQVNI